MKSGSAFELIARSLFIAFAVASIRSFITMSGRDAANNNSTKKQKKNNNITQKTFKRWWWKTNAPAGLCDLSVNVKYIIWTTICLKGCVSSPCCFLVSTKDSFGAFFTNGFRPCKRQTEWPADSNRISMCWGRTIVLVRGIALLYLHCYILIRPASNHIRTLFLVRHFFSWVAVNRYTMHNQLFQTLL